MRLLEQIKQEKENLEAIIKKSGAMLRHLPKGKLYVQERNGHLYCSKRVNGKQYYLPVGSSAIGMLADRKVVELVRDNAAKDVELMDHCIQNYEPYDPNELAIGLGSLYKEISRATVNALGFPYTIGFEEDSKQYAERAKYREHLKQTAYDGTKRRSRAELIIDEIYKLLNYPAVYEQPLELPDGEVIVPDYTTWSNTRNTYLYHEHIGKLTDPERNRENFWKFQEYVKAGIYPMDRVLFTFDRPDGSIDTESIKILIQLFMQ